MILLQCVQRCACFSSGLRIHVYRKMSSLCAKRLELEVGQIGGHREDTEGVGVAETTLPALYGDDRGASLDDVKVKAAAEAEPDTVVDVDLPLVALDAAGLGVPDRVDTTGEVQLARSLLVAGDYRQFI